MAELLTPQDIMFTPFEPKLKNRFLMNVDGIPAYLIKTAKRPQITKKPLGKKPVETEPESKNLKVLANSLKGETPVNSYPVAVDFDIPTFLRKHAD